VTGSPDAPGPAGGGSGGTTGALLREGAELLAAAGSETPRLDAELLLGHAIGVGRTAVIAHHDAPVGPDAARRYRADLERRAAGEPVAYLRGFKEFYGLAFEADPRALIPRPETERLVELAQAETMRRLGALTRDETTAAPLRIVDVGTGSGAIAVALAVGLRKLRALEAVEILAVDISPDALECGRAVCWPVESLAQTVSSAAAEVPALRRDFSGIVPGWLTMGWDGAHGPFRHLPVRARTGGRGHRRG